MSDAYMSDAHTCQNVTERMVGIAPCCRMQHNISVITFVPQCFSTFLGSVAEKICHVPFAKLRFTAHIPKSWQCSSIFYLEERGRCTHVLLPSEAFM